MGMKSNKEGYFGKKEDESKRSSWRRGRSRGWRRRRVGREGLGLGPGPDFRGLLVPS